MQFVLPNDSWLQPLVEYLPPGWEASEVGEPSDQDIVHEWPSLAEGARVLVYSPAEHRAALEYFAKKIEYAVAERSENYVFVHAGVVAVNGKALIFPGASYSGKSTLVAALVHQGATYFSDEYAIVTEEGIVLPYPRPISLRADLFFKEGRTDLSAYGPSAQESQLGLSPGSIMFLKYGTDVELQLEPMDYAAALIELIKNTVGFHDRPEMSFAHLHRLLERRSAASGTRGSAALAAQRILELA